VRCDVVNHPARGTRSRSSATVQQIVRVQPAGLDAEAVSLRAAPRTQASLPRLPVNAEGASFGAASAQTNPYLDLASGRLEAARADSLLIISYAINQLDREASYDA
jgi:hypothetical protein